MRICVDLDGTICTTKTPEQSYEDVTPLPGAVDTLEFLKQRGYYIVIHTARNMRNIESRMTSYYLESHT